MSKKIKITLTIIISIVLYAGLYFFLVKNSTPDLYTKALSIFITSLVFALIGIPVGYITTIFLQKKIPKKQNFNIIIGLIGLLWGYLFGWTAITGLALASYVAEKNTPNADPKAK